MKDDRLKNYIETMVMPAGAGGIHPFRDVGIAIELTNGEFVRRNIELGWFFR
jgi:hypothetical protein